MTFSILGGTLPISSYCIYSTYFVGQAMTTSAAMTKAQNNLLRILFSF